MKGQLLPTWLGERSQPYYGVLMLVVLLVSASCLAGYFLTHRVDSALLGERTGPATVLFFLPDAVLRDELLFHACGIIFYASALLWLAQRAIPWSSWLAAGSFTAVLALYLENAHQETHVGHVTTMLLIIYALWYHFYADAIRAALAAGRFWTSPLYPRWVHALSIWYVGLFYGFSGLTKLATSGLAWPNGVSMQLWTTLWGNPHSIWTHLILSHRIVAQGLQWATLIAETSGLLAIVCPRARPLIGLGLVGLHYGIVSVFGWAFHFNGILVGLVFLPFYDWVPRAVAWWDKRLAHQRTRHTSTPSAL
jgi:hypothetical protein